MRLRNKIDKNWKFHCGCVDKKYKANGIETERPWSSLFDDTEWNSIPIPHDWRIEYMVDENNKCPTSTVGRHLELRDDSCLPRDVAWYRKELSLDAIMENQRIYIEFEGVFRNSTLWVNGRQVGMHTDGYTGFIHDITSLVHFGDKPNILTLFVDAREPEGWWYDGAGIFRHVWLIATDPTHIDNWGIFITTPKIDNDHAIMRVQVDVRNTLNEKRVCSLHTDIKDADGKTVATLRKRLTFPANGLRTVTEDCRIDSPQLWSPDSPCLYTAVTTLRCGGKVIDNYKTLFGARWFEFRADSGFFLNGKHLKLKGECIHHDFGGLGTALPPRANEKTVETLKEMGSNIVRSAHNCAAPSLMEACDRLGMLFWAETRYLTLAPPEQTIPPLVEMIRRDRNHPSIITWALANTAGHEDGHLTEYLKALNAVVHQEDPTRPTSIGLEASADANANGFACVTDIVGYNGGGMRIDDRDHELFPERKMIISEYAAAMGSRGVYEDTPAPGAVGISMEDGAIDFMTGGYRSVRSQCLRHENNWKHIAERLWLAGGIIWVGIDHRGEANGWPCIRSQHGVFDICRFPKDTYYFYKQEWCDEPMIHLLPHWNWSGCDGETIEVWCYSNCEMVELFLNGESLGCKPTVKLGHIQWDVSYQPGELVAKATTNGTLVCETSVKTAGEPAILRLTADRSTIKADGEDLVFLTVSVHDADGVWMPVADNAITIEVDGTGHLLGLANGDPRCRANPKGREIRAFNGLLLATVQSAEESGSIEVMASAAGLQDAIIVVCVR